jgi:hypothetical protein
MKLHEELLELRQNEKRITSEILEKLQIMEDSRAYLGMGYSSLFDYLVRGLKYSEATAYQRQACVRLAQEVPEIKDKIDKGHLSLSGITTAYKHIRKLPTEKKREKLQTMENKSTRDIKKLFTEPSRPIVIKKTEYQDRVHLRLDLSRDQNQKLEKLKALKSHKHDIESLITELIDKELKTYEEIKFKKTTSQNPRQISKRLRNSVLQKANYQCQYPGCESNHFLQIDHILPVREGGDQRPENLQVLCASHNRMKG